MSDLEIVCFFVCTYTIEKILKKINIQTFEPQKTTNKTNILINFFFEHATYSKTCKFASPLCHLVCAAAVALILMLQLSVIHNCYTHINIDIS